MNSTKRGAATIFLIPFVQVIVATLLFVGLLYSQRDLTVITSLILVLGLGVWLWAKIGLLGVNFASMTDKERAFAGEDIIVRANIRNGKFVPIWFRLEAPLTPRLPRSSGGRTLAKEGSLLWYQKARFEWELNAKERGVHRVGPFRLAAGDIFDFCCRTREAEGFHEIIIYPRLVPLRSIALPKRDFFGVPGPRSPVHDPVFILGTRDYQNGQPAKHIHWKASARHNHLQEKVFESTQHEKVLLVVDVASFARHNAEDEFERTLEAVASLAARLDRQGHSVGLVANGTTVGEVPSLVPVARSHRHLSALLELLARLLVQPRGMILDLLQQRVDVTWGTSCVYFSCEEDETVAAAREYFARRRTSALCFVARSGATSGGSVVRRLDDLWLDAVTP